MSKKTSDQVRRRPPAIDDDPGEICESPLCFRFDVEFNPNTVTVNGVDLYDPDAQGDDVWTSFDVNLLSAKGQAAALKALKSAENGYYDIGCADKKCRCRRKGAKWSPWSNWNDMDITAGFSIPNPQPPPKRLRYRANGTLKVRSRLKIGTCYRIAIA